LTQAEAAVAGFAAGLVPVDAVVVPAGLAAGFGVAVCADRGTVADAARRSRADVSFIFLIIVQAEQNGELLPDG
jgi:phosphoribosylamine-glycine ligase